MIAPRSLFLAATGAALTIALAATIGLHQPVASAQAPADTARGMYLSGDAGQCMDCHGEGFKGAPLHIPGPPGVPWADAAPSLVGLTMFATDAQAVTFFTTGALPSGKHALGPMPQYRFNTADAQAIVAYLRSLKS